MRSTGLAAVFGGISGIQPIAVAGVVTMVAASVSLLFAYRERLLSAVTFQYVWDKSRGAALTAAAAVSVLFIGFSFWQRTEVATLMAERDRQLVEAYATSVATTAVEAWRSTGAHPTMREATGSLTVSTDLQTGDRVVYEVATSGDSHRIVAAITGDTGTIYRDTIGSNTVDARVITGKVRDVSSDRISIEDERGQTYSLLLAVKIPAMKPGEHVIAVTNPEMTQLMSIAVLGRDGTDTSPNTPPAK